MPLTSRHWVDLVTVAAILFALAWGFNQRSAAKNASLEADRVAPLAARAAVQDRLVGMQVSWPTLEPLPGRSTPTRTLDSTRRSIVWLMQPGNCLACFDENGLWNDLAATETLDAHLVLLGEVPARLRSHLATIRNTSIWTAEEADLQRALGPLLPNTKILINEEGVITMADARDRGQACGWSFNAQLGVILGGSSALTIRRSALEAGLIERGGQK